jgi:hypothetical protein
MASLVLLAEATTMMTRAMQRIFGSIILLFTLVASAAAMDINVRRLPDGFHMVFANGLIIAGDSERLRIALQTADRDRSGNKIIALNSGGGLVSEAFEIVAVMDQEKVSTYVLDGSECASACAQIVYLSGISRKVFRGGWLGIHSCSFEHFICDDLCNIKIAENAAKHGTAYQAIMVFMEQAEPSEMAWFDSWEADSWGFTFRPLKKHHRTKPDYRARRFAVIGRSNRAMAIPPD